MNALRKPKKGALKDNGYDIRDKLPYLFINLSGFEKIRYDYWKTVTRYFVENYVKRIYEWCEENNLKYTGHFMAEDYFEFTMQYIGSLMPAYEYMHIPGVDHLNRNINDVMTVKQVTSVAHQLGKKRALCEMFGCSGQNFSFEHHKWIADWNLIHGINLINPHLSLYSMRGERKRDYPPNLFYQQPWWDHNKHIADYCARLSYVLSGGKRITDILVIHSIESAWCHYNPTDMVLEEEGQFDTPDSWIEYEPSREFMVNELNFKFDSLINTLLHLHYDYDLGDESIIERHGRVDGKGFYIGQAGYKAILIPPCVTLRKSTVELLEEFVNSGGILIFIDGIPDLIDGSPGFSFRLEALGQKALILPLDAANIKKSLDSCVKSNISITGEGNEAVWYHLRKIDNKLIAFFANTDEDKERIVTIGIKAKGHVEQWDAFNGNVLDIPYVYDGGAVSFEYRFPPAGSLLIVVDSESEGNGYRGPEKRVSGYKELDNIWEIKPLNGNCVTLDYCTCTPENSEPTELIPIHRARSLTTDNKGNFSLSYFFDVGDWDGTGGMLVVESPERFKITLNGAPINNRFGSGYWLDKTFKTAAIDDIVRTGSNIVEVKAEGDAAFEVEAVYVLGDFEVDNQHNGKFKIQKRTEKFVSGNLIYQGYPFFTGKMSFRQKCSLNHKPGVRYLLEVEQQDSIAVEIYVNGNKPDAGIVRPYIWDITTYLKDGENNMEIVLTTSLHNLLGPHHSTKGEITACAPASFKDEKTWTDDYHFVELGIRKVRIISLENK